MRRKLSALTACAWHLPGMLFLMSCSPCALQTGQGICRDSRITKPPTRPQEGWSLVVKDRSGGELKQTFVATPDGRKHKLTPSEELYLERQKPKARAAYMPGP